VWFNWNTTGTGYCFHEIAEATAEDIDRALSASSFDNFASVAADTNMLRAWQPGAEDEAYLRTSGGDPWVLTFHDRATAQHLRSAARLTLDQVRRALQAFLSGGDDWRQVSDWHVLRAQAVLGKGDFSVRFNWQGLGERRETVYMEVTLDSPGFHAAATVTADHDEAVGVLRFFEEFGSLSGNWQRDFRKWNLSVSGWGRIDGDIGVEIALDQDFYQPRWTAAQRLIIERSAWPEMLKQFQEYVAAAEGT
jgi:hypothetical protein